MGTADIAKVNQINADFKKELDYANKKYSDMLKQGNFVVGTGSIGTGAYSGVVLIGSGPNYTVE